MKIPGLSFSLKRAVGISALKQKVAKTTGLPLTKQGLERKIGGAILKGVIGKNRDTALARYSHMREGRLKRFYRPNGNIGGIGDKAYSAAGRVFG